MNNRFVYIPHLSFFKNIRVGDFFCAGRWFYIGISDTFNHKVSTICPVFYQVVQRDEADAPEEIMSLWLRVWKSSMSCLVAHACTMLFGLIHVLNLSYPIQFQFSNTLLMHCRKYSWRLDQRKVFSLSVNSDKSVTDFWTQHVVF